MILSAHKGGCEQLALALGPTGSKRDWKTFFRSHSQNAAAFSLRLLGWSLTNVFVVLGFMLFVIVLLGDFGIEGAMAQLDNLASRYAEADLARRRSFDTLLAGTSLCLFVMVALLRRGSCPSFDKGAAR